MHLHCTNTGSPVQMAPSHDMTIMPCQGGHGSGKSLSWTSPTLMCCSSEPSEGWDYSITGAPDDSAMEVWVGAKDLSTAFFPTSVCKVRGRQSCTGSACVDLTGNACASSAWISGNDGPLCIFLKCSSLGAPCNVTRYTVSFNRTGDCRSALSKPGAIHRSRMQYHAIISRRHCG